jgi:hypothetical protein
MRTLVYLAAVIQIVAVIAACIGLFTSKLPLGEGYSPEVLTGLTILMAGIAVAWAIVLSRQRPPARKAHWGNVVLVAVYSLPFFSIASIDVYVTVIQAKTKTACMPALAILLVGGILVFALLGSSRPEKPAGIQ